MIISPVSNKQIVKTFGGADYQPLKFSIGLEFLISNRLVHNLQSLAVQSEHLEDQIEE